MWRVCGFVILMICLIVFWTSLVSYHHKPAHEIKWCEFLEQPDDISCGPATATMILRRYGRKVTLEEVRTITNTEWFDYAEEHVGFTTPDQIDAVFDCYGLKSKIFQGNLAQLKYYVNHNRPCVVLLRSGIATWHYVVVFGYTEKEMIIADPAYACRITLSTDVFAKAWDFDADVYGCPTSGFISDLLVCLLKLAEVHPNTMIVPGIDIERGEPCSG